MPVDVRSQRALGIVGVNHVHVVEPEQALRFGQHVAEPGGIGDIETTCQ